MNPYSPCFNSIAKHFIDTAAIACYCDLKAETILVLKGEDFRETGFTRPFEKLRQDLEQFSKDSIHPEDRKILKDNLDLKHIRQQLEKSDSYTFNYRRFIDGRAVAFRSVVIRGEDSDHAVILLMDITEELKKEERITKAAREAQMLVDNLTATFNIVYIVDMSDDSLQITKMDSHMLESKGNFRVFSDARDFFLSNVVHFRDREFMTRELDFSTIRDRLAGTSSYNVEYRVIKNNVTYGGEMLVTAIEGSRIAIGMGGSDKDLVMRHMQQKRYNDYFALFVIDIDTGMLKVMKTSPWYKTGKAGEATPYTKAILDFAGTLDGEPRAFFTQLSDMEFIRRELAHEDKHAYSYKSNLVTLDTKWVNVVSYVTIRHEDGTPAEFTLGFSLVDSMESRTKETQLRLKEDMHMIGGLASGYLALCYVNIDENTCKVYSIDSDRLPDTRKLLSEDVSFDTFTRFIQSDAIHPDDRQLFAGLDFNSVRQMLAHTRKCSIRFRRNYSGQYLWSEMDIIKYEDIDSPANALIIGFSEIDETVRRQEKQQEQLKEALNMAQAANRAKTTFLNNMSHDIRTPMNAIIGFTNLAAGHIDDKAKVSDCLSKIDKSSSHLLSLINDVLDMSRIESGKMTVEEKQENLNDIVSALRDIIQADIQAKGHTLYVDTSGVSDNDIFCDRLRLNQVLLNILSNSIKYTPAGGTISLCISQRTVKSSGYAIYEFRIKDNGMGMSQDYLKMIFEPFMRVKSTTVSGIQGTGLGMAITKALVDMMDGQITVSSELGKGTETVITFGFRLAADNAANSGSDNDDSTAIDISGTRILLVEDNELNREIATAILEEKGCIVTPAEDGSIAVSLIGSGKNGDYDLILMDIQMPVMNGYEATRQIRLLGTPLSDIPIIAMTANAFEEDRKAALEAGMDEHIAKPINPDRLIHTIGRFLEKKQ